MRQFKRGLWKAGIALCGMQLFLALVMWLQVSATEAQAGTSGLATPVTITAQATATEDNTVTALNKEKLLQDVDQQQHTLGNWFWNNGAAIISSLVLVIAGVFTVFRYLRDQRNEREKQRNEHQIEREKRAEERFQSAVAALGDEKEGTRIGAAILLRTFLHPDYEQFHTQIFDLVVANLRLPRTAHQPVDPMTPFSQALVTLIKESFPLVRMKLQKEHPQFSPESLDASRILLDHAYLSGADLKQAWLPVASLRGANLYMADLTGADLNEADLSKAYLSKIYLRNAGLRAANLSGAELQYAHLNEAYMRHANLKGADLSEADLSHAILEEADLSKVLLSGANLSHADLEGANLSGAILNATRNFMTAHMAEMNLDAANLSGADLTRANLTGANLSEVNLEAALSLKDADVRQVIGLTKEQLVACRAKGAILDEDATTLSS